MTFLIVGIDRTTLAPWHRNVFEHDVAAPHGPLSRAGADGVDLAIAAVIGPNSSVLP